MKDQIKDIEKNYNYFVEVMTHVLTDSVNLEIINDIREIYARATPHELRELIAKHFIPTDQERKSHAEIPTPVKLVNEMLDVVPSDFWTQPHTVFEPCCGKGNFVIGIFERFNQGLAQSIPDPIERCRVIMQHCLYFADINPMDVFITTEIMKCHVRHYTQTDEINYQFNSHVGDTLTLDIFKQWKLKGFDAIIGNPPYQEIVGPRKTQPKWNLFVIKMFPYILKDGYLVMVHPSGWRSPTGVFKEVFDLVNSRKILYLSMHDFKQGQEVFGLGTNFDYYVMQNAESAHYETTVQDIDNNVSKINLKDWDFIPSGGFSLYDNLIAKNEGKVNVLHDYSSYETRKAWMSKTRNSEFSYPCVYTITERDGLNLYYSSVKNGHFGVPKVIWSNGLGTYPVVDENGEYGLTQFSYAIVDSISNLQHIADAMNRPDFIKLMNYVKFTNNKYNHKVISLFKKDFWKYFIDVAESKISDH